MRHCESYKPLLPFPFFLFSLFNFPNRFMVYQKDKKEKSFLPFFSFLPFPFPFSLSHQHRASERERTGRRRGDSGFFPSFLSSPPSSFFPSPPPLVPIYNSRQTHTASRRDQRTEFLHLSLLPLFPSFFFQPIKRRNAPTGQRKRTRKYFPILFSSSFLLLPPLFPPLLLWPSSFDRPFRPSLLPEYKMVQSRRQGSPFLFFPLFSFFLPSSTLSSIINSILTW